MTISTTEQRNKLTVFLMLFIIALVLGILLSNLLQTNPFSLLSSPPLAGGDTTVFNRTSSGYEQPAAGLSTEELEKHRDGDIAFAAVFVTPPATVNAGLGPLFNNASCAGCHIRDGRGMPEKGQLLARVSTTDPELSRSIVDPSQYHREAAVEIENTPVVPGLGNQIQDQAVYGSTPEAQVEINWQETIGKYIDGSTYKLRSPQVNIVLPDGKTLPDSVQTSLRLPPPVFGLGLLEAIPEQTIRDLADSKDKNKDGISGRTNQVWDGVKKTTTLGRFGWKANNPNLMQQVASAYVNDMGVTNPLFPEGNSITDIDRTTLEQNTFYVQTLAVPNRTMLDDPQVQKGEKLFTDANCAVCHLQELRTGDSPIQILANQKIHPYTDMLIHDMGEGLADNRSDFEANGKEWRTTPLWGIGLTQTVLPYSSYLHDGRARTLEEAILWHGGEAKSSREAFRKMNKDDRHALVKFLRSL